jgi:hypothetical protein
MLEEWRRRARTCLLGQTDTGRRHGVVLGRLVSPCGGAAGPNQRDDPLRPYERASGATIVALRGSTVACSPQLLDPGQPSAARAVGAARVY